MQRTTALPAGFNGADRKPWAADIHVTPDGRFLYASERTTNTLAAYKIDSDSGKLTTIVAKVEAIGPKSFHMDLPLLENRFQFKRALEALRQHE